MAIQHTEESVLRHYLFVLFIFTTLPVPIFAGEETRPVDEVTARAISEGTEKYGCLIREEVEKKDLPIEPKVIIGQIFKESSFNESAQGPKGGRGLMQPLPSTAEHVREQHPEENLGSNLSDPETNIRTGILYLGMLSSRDWSPGNTCEALLAYNRGPVNASKWLQKHKNACNDPYVKRIFQYASVVPEVVCDSRDS